MDKFLSESNQPGTRESEGAFTISLEAALKKLEMFQLGGPGAALLKLVQVANALDCEAVDFKIGVRATRALFHSPRWEEKIAPHTLACLLAGRDTEAGPAARHLTVALRAARGARAREVAWRPNPSSSLVLSDKGAQLEAEQDGTLENPAVEIRRDSWAGGLRAKLFGGEHKELYQRCRWSKTAVKIDSRPVDLGWDRTISAQGHWYEYQSLPYFLMEGYWPPGPALPSFLHPPIENTRFGLSDAPGLWRNSEITIGEAKLEIPIKLGQLTRTLTQCQTLYRFFASKEEVPEDGPFPCGAAFVLPLKLKGPAEICFLLDGVTSQPKTTNLGCPGLQCLVSGEGLNVDLTEFSIIEDDVYKARLKSIEEVASRFVAQVKAQRANYKLLHSVATTSRNYSQAALSDPSYAPEFHQGVLRRLKGR